jgi:hypothetical protein
MGLAVGQTVPLPTQYSNGASECLARRNTHCSSYLKNKEEGFMRVKDCRQAGSGRQTFFLRNVVLYGCETWSLTLREDRRLRVFENRVLRRVFGRKRDEVTGEWRKLHNEELNDPYSLPNIVRVVKSRRMRWAGHVARMGEDRGVYRVL